MGWPGPVDEAVFLLEHAAVDRLRIVLGGVCGGAVCDLVDGLCQHAATLGSETVREFGGGFVLADDRLLLQHDGAGIHFEGELHDCYARYGVAGNYRALKGGRSPPARQEARVHVDEAVGRHVEDGLLQEAAIGRDGAHRRLLFPQPGLEGAIVQFARLVHGKPVLLCPRLYRGRGEFLAAALGLVRLADDRHDLMPFGHGRQTGHGEVRRAKEDGAHLR